MLDILIRPTELDNTMITSINFTTLALLALKLHSRNDYRAGSSWYLLMDKLNREQSRDLMHDVRHYQYHHISIKNHKLKKSSLIY